MRMPKLLLDGDERLAAFERSAEAGAARMIVGWREWVSLPELGIARIQAKFDTGATSSALHADHIRPIERQGRPWVRFHIIGERGETRHEAALSDRRRVRSSSGRSEERCLVRTRLHFAGHVWTVDLTLANREPMVLPMLVGREAMSGRLLVDPSKSWLWDRPKPSG